jgi:hypothetical protein
MENIEDLETWKKAGVAKWEGLSLQHYEKEGSIPSSGSFQLPPFTPLYSESQSLLKNGLALGAPGLQSGPSSRINSD